MEVFKIIKINNNIEVLSKVLNSVAAKYDYRIECDTETRKVNSHCDANAKPLNIREIMGLLGAN